ncbi:hypothetical protein [Priestia megaterium]|uniref:hypothetical protein n=1 Tax=Priestia megaterium TaxID=1404 RepID=UPI000BFC7190|nr:hypothetical protein [Priestia megaterium]PGQ88200.1 hypothetical protein COA18_04550 [Priestia megaterium]
MDKYLEELEKIANEITIDENQEPMLEDPKPPIPPEEIEAEQAANSEPADSSAAEEQLPPSPEDVEALNDTIDSAEQELHEAQEHLAEAEKRYSEFEKVAAPVINDSLPAMGAFAKLIDFSTDSESDPILHKVAKERLQTALSSEDLFFETLQKTATELFDDEANLNALYTQEGMEYVVETLDSFANDEEFSKEAFETGSVIGKAVDTIKEFGDATKNFWKLRSELGVAKAEADRLAQQATQTTTDAITAANNPNTPGDELNAHLQAQTDATTAASEAKSQAEDLSRKVVMGGAGWGAGGAGVAAGSLFGGKKVYDALHPDEEVAQKTASENTYQQNTGNYYEGGQQKMSQSVVQDFLKIAGAAGLLNIANNEEYQEELRKEAAEQFNYISRLARADMEDSFVKVATSLYSEDQLHEIVAGKHNEELFDKVSFFIAANDASADELEKVAGADGVAAKGVGGALTDAKKQVEEHIEEEKRKTETGNLQPGSTKAQDTSGYNVTNNPQKYDVDKTAHLLEQAQLQKQAAIEAYAEAENFLNHYGR